MNLDRFRLTPSRIERVLQAAMSRGGDYADLFCEYSRFEGLGLEEGILKSAVSNIECGAGVRVVIGEKSGYAYTELLEESHLLSAAKTAAAIAQDHGSQHSFSVGAHAIGNYYPVPNPMIDESMDEKIQFVYLADRSARAHSTAIKQVSVYMGTAQRLILMADSRGRLVEDVQPMLRFTVSVVVEKNGERQNAMAGDGGRLGADFLTSSRVEMLAKKAVDEALVLLEAKPAPAGMWPVILAPGDSGILLHEAIGHPLEADFNRKQSSAYSNRLGQMVADSQCTIVDDGTVASDRGAINVDDELNESQRTVLIEEGRLRSYMCDEMSARFFDIESTGNGRRESYRFQPMPRMRTTYMLPGKYSADEIIKSTSKGLYCKTFRGGQVNISNGNFTFVPSEAYWIEDGKMTYPVKNCTLIGNGPDALSKVSMVGSDFAISAGIWTCGKEGQSAPVGVGLPTIKISEMTVGGSSG